MAWTIDEELSDGVYVGIHPNSGAITYDGTKGMCGPELDEACKGVVSATTTASLLSGASFDNFTTVRKTITYSYKMESCNKDGFVCWFKDAGPYSVLNNNNGFDEKNVDECDIVVKGAPLQAGANYYQYFAQDSYVDSGYPEIIKNPYHPLENNCGKYDSEHNNGASHKIKYHTLDETIRTHTIINNPHLTELYFPHLYINDEKNNVFQGGNIHFIEDSAFENNSGLTAITFSAVRTIGDRAFFNCNSLQNIDWGHCECKKWDCNIGDSIESGQCTWREERIGDSAFTNCYDLPELHLNELVYLNYLGEYSFYDCHSLSALTLPSVSSPIHEIKDYTFWNCRSLSAVDFNNSSITQIGDYAFSGGCSLNTINISKILRLGKGSFKNCSGATSLYLSQDLNEIPEECFMDCSSLTSLNYNINGKTDEHAFENCTSLSGVSAYTTAVTTTAFDNCTSLENLKITGERIEDGAFMSSDSLRTVEIIYFRYIGEDSFRGSTALTKVTLNSGPSRNSEIANNAFSGCTSLATVDLTACNYVPTLGTNVFDGVSANLKIWVQERLVDSFKAAQNWSAYSSYIYGRT